MFNVGLFLIIFTFLGGGVGEVKNQFIKPEKKSKTNLLFSSILMYSNRSGVKYKCFILIKLIGFF